MENFVERVRGRGLRVVLPEGADERIAAAARRLVDERIAAPIVLGSPDAVSSAATQAGVSLDGIEVIDPASDARLDGYTRMYAERRGLSESVSKRLIKRPLFFAGMMVAEGDADSFVAGAATATALVIQAGALTVGLAPGIDTPSSFFLMIIPEFQGRKDRPLIFADCAVNVQPGASELADIAVASAASAERLLGEPARVALLSFATFGSASHADVDKVHEAVAIVREKAPHITVDGELQADAALIPRVAAKKVKQPSGVAGQANVLIFPDLDAGNIAYKLTQYLAQAKAIGPFLQGFARPISDLSRGATVQDIVDTTAIVLAQV